jgi:L,D-transpeptidase catalytic domain
VTLVVSLWIGATGASAQLPGEPEEPAPPPPEPIQQPSELQLEVKGARNGRVVAGHTVKVLGTLRPFAPDQKVQVTIWRGDHAVKDQVVDVGAAHHGEVGEFHLRSPKLVEPDDYTATAVYEGSAELARSEALSHEFGLRYPALRKGNRGPEVNLFNELLAKQGYATSHGKKYTQTTGWGVLAFRKVHGMGRIQSATSGIFKTLAEGRGEYGVQHPHAGRHAEVNLAKQVLVLAEGDNPVRTYHISSGTIATPSDLGGFTFYRRQPGFNAIGMYYSTYYHGGEAVHGYRSVPTHPASHGCIRVPIPQAREIYNWVQLGMPIFVY